MQVAGHVFREQGRDGIHAAVMGEHQRRLPVRIGAALFLVGDEGLGVGRHHRLPPVTVQADVRIVLAVGGLEAFLHFTEGEAVGVQGGVVASVLLKNHEVAADLRACLVGKKAVGQAVGPDKAGVLYQLLTDGIVGGGIHEAAGRDEGDKASLAHLVEGFQEEIVVDGLR